MSVIELAPADMASRLSGLSLPSLVFFHKQNCSPCGDMMLRVREISARFPALDVYAVDVTHGSDGLHGYTNGGTPLVVLFDERGLEEWRWRGGSVTVERMSTQIREMLA